MKEVTIYTTPGCIYCVMAKDWFRENNVNFTEHNVAADAEKREEMIKKTGQMAVPVIIVGNDIIIGFDKKKLASLLSI